MASLNEYQIGKIEEFRESKGKVNNGLHMYYDLSFECYISISKKNGVKTLKPESAKKLLSANFRKVPSFLLLDEVPIIESFFDTTKSKVMEVDEDTNIINYNYFDIEQTNMGECKILRDELGLVKDVGFLKLFPSFKCLFENLFSKDVESLDYIINYLSTAINLRCKVPVAIILFGDQGAGKGVIEEYLLRYIFGDIYVSTLGNAQLEDDRNNAFFNKNLIIFNEVETDYTKNKVDNKIKGLITDSRMIVKKLYSNPIEVVNNFNMWFMSNKNNPIKLDMDDRRANVFNTVDTLMNAVEKDFGKEFITGEDGKKTLDKYLDLLSEEQADFVGYIKRYDYSMSKAKRVLNSKEKNIMARTTSTVKDKLKYHLNKGDFLTIKYDIEEAVEISQGLEKVIDKRDSMKKLSKLEDSMSKGFVDLEDITFLYNIFLNDRNIEASSTKIGIAFTSILCAPSRYNGKNVRKLKNSYIPSEEKEHKFAGGNINLDGTTDLEDEFKNEIQEKDSIKEAIDNEKKIEEEKVIIKNRELNDYTRINNREDFMEEAERCYKDSVILDYELTNRQYAYFKVNEDQYVVKQDLLSEEDISRLRTMFIPF